MSASRLKNAAAVGFVEQAGAIAITELAEFENALPLFHRWAAMIEAINEKLLMAFPQQDSTSYGLGHETVTQHMAMSKVSIASKRVHLL